MFVELKDKKADLLSISNITDYELELEIYGPDNVETYRKLSIEKSQTDGYYILVNDYSHSPIQDFESYLRFLTGLNENDIQLIIKQKKSKFITYKISPGFYTFTGLAEVLSRGFKLNFETGKLQPIYIYDRPDSISIESDNVSLSTKLTVRYAVRVLKFDEKSFFTTVLGFSPFWD